VTIPKSVRNLLGIKASDSPDFVIADHDDAVLGSVNGIRELRGMLKVRRRAVSVDEMNAAVLREHASKR
jgi:bifunctional DNA-binding transcriptional regulator/antitoxin component of YhaV-PrlF toxin-antitoxin module